MLDDDLGGFFGAVLAADGFDEVAFGICARFLGPSNYKNAGKNKIVDTNKREGGRERGRKEGKRKRHIPIK